MLIYLMTQGRLKHLEKSLEQSDFVIGSRYVPGGEYEKLRSNQARSRGSFYARTILGLGIRDLTGGYNLWKREVLENIGLNDVKSEGYAFQIELKYRGNSQKDTELKFQSLLVVGERVTQR